MNYWEIYQKLCTEINKTPNAVALELGFSNATCTKWSKGSIPNGNNAAKIAEYFGVTTDYLHRTEYIKLPKLVSSEREVFDRADIRTLWNDFLTEHSTVTACILTMLYTGIRPGELLTIKTENVHTAEHYMTGGIKTTKGKNRKIIIPDKLLPVIGYLLDNSAEGLLAYYKNDNDFYDDWKTKRSELGLRTQLTPYCCRHTYITNLTALKVSPAMLQELAGHEDYDTTLEYTHLSIADRLAEVNRLA